MKRKERPLLELSRARPHNSQPTCAEIFPDSDFAPTERMNDDAAASEPVGHDQAHDHGSTPACWPWSRTSKDQGSHPLAASVADAQNTHMGHWWARGAARSKQRLSFISICMVRKVPLHCLHSERLTEPALGHHGTCIRFSEHVSLHAGLESGTIASIVELALSSICMDDSIALFPGTVLQWKGPRACGNCRTRALVGSCIVNGFNSAVLQQVSMKGRRIEVRYLLCAIPRKRPALAAVARGSVQMF